MSEPTEITITLDGFNEGVTFAAIAKYLRTSASRPNGTLNLLARQIEDQLPKDLPDEPSEPWSVVKVTYDRTLSALGVGAHRFVRWDTVDGDELRWHRVDGGCFAWAEVIKNADSVKVIR